MKVCETCGSAVRKGRGGGWYHKLPGFPELETRVKGVTDEQYAKAPGVGPERIPPPKSHMVTEAIEGF